MHKALASCYLRSPAPVLMRGLRDRYRLHMGSEGWLPMRLKKRTEPAARILYYHRVNNDNDPFFPAIQTALFEQQMRYVAENYKVVDLATLIDHLDKGESETLFAITFDDGYADNFHNALPVLERYGLPATIFLTTGSIDSREPLWFERFALAFKRTSRTEIAVDIAGAHRFPLRTLAERLEANGSIYEALRGIPEAARQEALSRIFSALGVSDFSERRSVMLTWDQIRAMTGRGISFGGHTVTHPFLSKTGADQAQWEVSECKRRIEQETQCPAPFFAYPNGHEWDFSEVTETAVRNAGYRAAMSSIWGLNYPSTGRMALRRGGPWEEDFAQFALKLDWYELTHG